MIHDTVFYNWKIGGEAGYGIMNTGGPLFAKTLLRAGYYIFIYSEYPSLIRGGHNTMQVAVSDKEVSGVYSQIDQLVALNAHTIVMHQDEVKKGGVVVYDEDEIKLKTQSSKLKTTTQNSKLVDSSRIPNLSGSHTVKKAKQETILRQDIKFIPINFTKIAEDIGGNKIMKNVAAVGASLRITNYDLPAGEAGLRITNLLDIAKEVIAGVFKSKGQTIIKANQMVLEAGYAAV